MKRSAQTDPSLRFLSQYFWPEETATAEMLSGIAFEIAARGFQVNAIAGHPAYRRAAKLPRRLEKRGVTVRRVPATRLDRTRAAGRVLNTATFAASAFAASVAARQPDALIAVTNPPLLPWVARLNRRIRRTPYVLVIHDVYPQIAAALGRIRADSTVARLWRRLNRRAYRDAAAIVALGECMAEVLRAELPAEQASKVIVIPNWADGEAVRPVARARHPLLVELRIEQSFVVQYSGNIGLFHEIATLVDAAERLRDTEVHFLFLGDGGQLPWLEDAVRKRGLENVTLRPFQPRDQLPLTLTACDAGLVTLKEEATGFCVPSKFYGILAAGKPVVAVMNPRCEIAQSIQRHRCGVVVPPGDAETLAAEIRRLQSEPERLRRMGDAARAAYERNYTLAIVGRKYGETVERIAGKPVLSKPRVPLGGGAQVGSRASRDVGSGTS